MPSDTIPLTPEDAVALLERRHDGSVHTIGRACGADWSRDEAERYLWNAESIRWDKHYSGHNVRAVAPDGRAIRFMTESGKTPIDAPALRAKPFVPDPLGEIRRIAAEDGIDIGLNPGNGEWVVRVRDGRIVEWGAKV